MLKKDIFNHQKAKKKDWKKIKRLIFKSTKFGDDTDRALQKNDGSWTYFANDIAYHMDKVNRKYHYLINILRRRPHWLY